jgi:hypothetical protein
MQTETTTGREDFKMRKLPVLMCAALLVCAVAATSEVSADKGWFAGFSVGQTSWEGIAEEFDPNDGLEMLDDSDLGYIAFVGYQITSHFGVVSGFAELGETSASGTYPSPPPNNWTWEWDIKGPFAAAMGIFPVNDRFVTFVTAGYLFWDYGYVVTEDNPVWMWSGSGDGTSFMYGAGANFWLNSKKNSGIHVEWDRFDAIRSRDVLGAEVDIDLFSVGLVYHFGR